MKERPILFNAPMVRAILDGRKTQTRRIVKPVGSDEGFVILDYGNGDWPYRSDDGDSTTHTVKRGGKLYLDETPHSCPYGDPGDRLWVRETWRIGAWDENRPAFALDYCDGPRKEWVTVPDPMGDDGAIFDRLWQQSTDDAIKSIGQQDSYKWEPGQSPCRWRPSIHMPRWASRILLEVVSVRVERLQDISDSGPQNDCTAEGVFHCGMAVPTYEDWHGDGFNSSEKWMYKKLCESINGAGSWATNPWVWVVEFKRVTP